MNPMNVAITGSSGMLGTELTAVLSEKGHRILRLVRRRPRAADEAEWNPGEGRFEAARLEGFDGVVHLAGENIGSGRWTAAKKNRIRESRVRGTRFLAGELARLPNPPKTLICASAIGYYGDRGEEVLTEESAPGQGFLAEVCREWEAAAKPAREAGIRCVHLRFGVILSPRGGALARMLTPFRLGAGGPIGSGRQWMSWISLDDAANAVVFALIHAGLSGPVNAVAPQNASNREFTRTLARMLRRPAIFPMPAFAARLAFGEMADALLLASSRVEPARLKAEGYAFRHPDLEGALRHLLGR